MKLGQGRLNGISSRAPVRPLLRSGFCRNRNSGSDRSNDNSCSMSAMMRSFFFAAYLFCALTQTAVAQSSAVERDIKALPGRERRVGVYTTIRPDCTSGPLPAIRLANAPVHGTVSVKRATLKATNVKQCLAIDVPAFAAFYRAAQNFGGDDEFELEVSFAAGRKELQHIRVHVSNDPASGQGI
jgi:hypothetical protein